MVFVEYEADRLYGARRTFGASSRAEGFLFGVRPDVWPLDAPILPLVLPDLPNLGPPPNLRSSRPQAQNQTIFYGTQPLKTYNPSLAAAPRGLYPRCAFVLALRVDGLHQCSSSTTPYRSEQTLAETDWFQGTAIAMLDASLAILGWTWLVNSPPYQIATKGANPAAVRAARCMQHGASDHSFLPSWAKQTFDARIFNVAGGLVVTYACPACLFSLSPLRFSAQPTADGGVSQLRAWAPHRITYPSVKWTNGRNQVLFTYRPPPRPSAARNVSSGAAGAAEERDVRERLMIQPRLGVIGSLGRPRFAVHGRRVCRTHVPRNPTRPFPPVPSAANCHGDFGRDPDCGTFPDGSTIDVVRFEGVWEKRAKLRNDSRAQVEASLRASGLYGGLSLTSNLVKVRWREQAGADGGGGGASGGGAGGGGWFGGGLLRSGGAGRGAAAANGTGAGCEVLLGVGHLHRGEGTRNRILHRRRANGPSPWEQTQSRVRRRQPFAFGYRYTHFWYVLSARYPFEVLGASGEFCLASAQDAADCESIQFVSALAHATPEAMAAHMPRQAAGARALRPVRKRGVWNLGSQSTPPPQSSRATLMLAYGVNDCEARVGFVELARVLRAVRPLVTGGRICA